MSWINTPKIIIITAKFLTDLNRKRMSIEKGLGLGLIFRRIIEDIMIQSIYLIL